MMGGAVGVASRLACELATNPQYLAKMRLDPVLFADLVCMGVDFEQDPPKVFKPQLWPWQRRFVRHMAQLEQYNPQTPFHRPNRAPRYIVLKTRGCGATWTTIWLFVWALWAKAPCQILIMSDVEEKAKDLLSRVAFVIANLPPALGMRYKRGGDSTLVKKFVNGSEIISLSGNPERIRSYHPWAVLVDEAAQLQADPRPPLMGLKGISIVLSTANGYGNPFAQMYEDAEDNSGEQWGYIPIFLPWTVRPDISERPVGDPRLRSQEYPETAREAFLTSGRPYFDLAAALELEQAHVRPPMKQDENGSLRIWWPPKRGQLYVIAADTAKGRQQEADMGDERGGSDFSAATIAEWGTCKRVATFHARLPEFQFADMLYRLWRQYPGIIIPERNGPGEVVCKRLAMVEPGCIYFDHDGKPGWINTVTSRAHVLDVLHKSMYVRDLKIPDRGLWSEVRTFGWQESGKVEANAGFHDDRVLSEAIAQWYLTEGRRPVPRGAESLAPLPRVKVPF